MRIRRPSGLDRASAPSKPGPPNPRCADAAAANPSMATTAAPSPAARRNFMRILLFLGTEYTVASYGIGRPALRTVTETSVKCGAISVEPIVPRPGFIDET